MFRLGLPILAMLLAAGATSAAEQIVSIDEARALRLGGHYGEAEEAYRSLTKAHPVEATVGLARTLSNVGRYAAAERLLRKALAERADAALNSELGRLEFRRGDHKAAARHVARALAVAQGNRLARWLQAELFRTSGKLPEANDACRWLVGDYNAHDVSDAESLRWIGLAAANYARWNRLKEQFRFLVSDLYPDALAADKNFWPAHYEAGMLFLEKFNQAKASSELKAALAQNPRSAEVYAALARLAAENYDLDEARQAAGRALEINPHLIEAHLVLADLEMANFRAERALERLETARRENPINEATLGRIAAAMIARDGWPEPLDGTPLGTLMAEVDARNPHAGEFYLVAGVQLEGRRKFAAAFRMLRRSLDKMPQGIGARAALGMMQMRLGQEDQARRLLGESFEIDPFNVRVSNTLKVLEVLEGYKTLETPHFFVRFDPREHVLARLAADYLEQVYSPLCHWLGYEPRGKTLFEIFSSARHTDAHGWFSARMVGLPYVGTVGACAGKMVALTSPNELKKKFNWARVLKHEFVHVINLEQTGNNIPHWFTEALAVHNEGYPRPAEWTRVLVARHARKTLFDLDTINLGFIRPQSSEDWTLAYCQAELYAEYIMKTFGDPAIARMLDAYADNLPTPEALQRALGVNQKTFEQGYRKLIDQLVAGAVVGEAAEPVDLARLERRQQSEPDSAELASRLAYEYLRRKSYPSARHMAQVALRLRPRDGRATYVLARLYLSIGDTAKAVELLESAYEATGPQKNLVALLAALKYKAKQYDEAAALYGQAAERDPENPRWLRLLARVYLKTGETRRLTGVLTRLAEMDADDFLVRKKLAQLALAREDYPRVVNWARDAMHVDVLDAQVHRMLGQALVATADPGKAISAFETAVELAPDEGALRMALADACMQAQETEKARRVLEDLLTRQPDYPGADVLLESLKHGD